MTSVFAHQGGWDELLLVVAPIAVFAVVLVVANRKANKLAASDDAGADADGGSDPTAPG